MSNRLFKRDLKPNDWRRTLRLQTSIVVVNWNRRSLLERCIYSIEQQTSRDFELILVDNGSTDGSLDCLHRTNLPALRLICNLENRGFGRAVNQGIAVARGQFIALVNNDVCLDSNWLEEMERGFKNHSEIGMYASKILFAKDPNRIDKVGHLIYSDGQCYGRGHREQDIGQYNQIEEVLWPDGAAAIYCAEVFHEIGLFDEEFFAYCDDSEFGMRAQLFGWKCLYIPTALAYHDRSATLGVYAPDKVFLLERNRIWLAIKLMPAQQLAFLPFYSGARYLFSLWALIARRGDIGRAAREESIRPILYAVLRAHAAAISGARSMWLKRKEIKERQLIRESELICLLKRHSIGILRLVAD